MTAEQARFALELMLPDLENEIVTTKKVLAALPEDQSAWRPHEKGKAALELAWHIAGSELWFLEGIAAGGFSQAEPAIPENLKSGTDVAQWYGANIPPAFERVKALPGEALSKILDFYGAFQRPAVTYLSFLTVHSVHHRGQLSTYLRAMGAKVPSIYGGSADEPWQG